MDLTTSPIYQALPIDLHCHSTCSDGTFSPTQVVEKAAERGIQVLSLTDHDNIQGLNEAKALADQHQIIFIHGVEISCRHRLIGGYAKKPASVDKVIHVLGYDFEDTQTLNQRLSKIQSSRENRGYAICEKVAKMFHLNADDLWQQVLTKTNHNPKMVGRTHIASVMVENGLVNDIQKAFSGYLADYKSCYVPLDGLNLKDCIQLIHQCGGVASLAHVTRYGLTSNKVRKLISDFAQAGGDAIELPATNEPPSTRHMVDRCIKTLGLKVSIGSDFHGTTMPWRQLGQTPKLHEGQIGIWQNFKHF